MLQVITGNIGDREMLKKYQINAIVNAANPTLMGSDQGVDGSIHSAINKLLKGGKGSFKDRIKEETDKERILPDNTIRCQRGQAVTTGGYGLCDYVIHTVGTKFDGKNTENTDSNYRSCSSSRIRLLESCYYSVVGEIRKHADIERIAVPIISSGKYGFPFELAVKIAVVSMGNALVEWKDKDPEMFELSGIKEVFFILERGETESQESFKRKHEYLRDTLNFYRNIFKEDQKAAYQSSFQANFQILQEIIRYDNIRGYFSIARAFRFVLTIVRTLCLFWTAIKDGIGREAWKTRREVVEYLAVAKIVFPLMGCILLKQSGAPDCFLYFLMVIVVYSLVDTVSYLLSLIVMADIQRPSANVIRSCILLFVNYIESSLDMVFLYYLNFRQKENVLQQAVRFGFLGDEGMIVSEGMHTVDYILGYLNIGLKFFFITMVFGYFAGHMKQREFKS